MNMKYRILGRTGLKVSELAFGGIMLNNIPQDQANTVVADAVDRGINFFDVGPTYGNAQKVLGSAAKFFRDDIYLACKTEPEKTKDEVRKDIENSLRLLKTDHFDLYQLHEVTDEDSLNKALAPGGALEAIVEAKEEGLIDNIGFSAHSRWAALKLMDNYDFDTVMFPVNWNYWFNYNQGPEVIQRARETDKGIIAIKSLAEKRWQGPKKDDYKTWYKPIYDNLELAELAFKFTLSKDIDTAVSPGDIRMLELALDLLEKNENNMELSEQEMEKLLEYKESHGGKLYPIPK